MEDFRKELIVLLNFKCMRQIEIQFQVLKNKKKRVSKCVRDTDDTRVKVSNLVLARLVAAIEGADTPHPPATQLASHCGSNLLDCPSLA